MDDAFDHDAAWDRREARRRRFALLMHAFAATMAGLLAVLSTSASADIRHHLRFAQPAKALVWSSDAELQIAGRAAPLVLGAGSLDPIGAPTDFVVEAPDLATARFRVASNAPFSIDARWLGGSTDFDPSGVNVRLDHRPAGAAAQSPGPAADLGLTLADLSAGVRIFFGDRRTAARPGDPRDQATEFEVVFQGPGAEQAARVAYQIALR